MFSKIDISTIITALNDYLNDIKYISLDGYIITKKQRINILKKMKLGRQHHQIWNSILCQNQEKEA
jgi:hypothetical protein